MTVFSRYNIQLQQFKAKKIISNLDTIFTTGWHRKMFGEVFLSLITPYPFLIGLTYSANYPDMDAKVVYYINDLLLCLSMFIRIQIIARFSLTCLTDYMEPRAKRVCSMHGVEASFMYAVKAVMKAKPYSFLAISLLVSVSIPGYCLRIFEKPLIPFSGQNFDYLPNCYWCMIITMTTVGYGDFYPVSQEGRLIAIAVSLWGVFIVSIFVVTLTNLIEFENNEAKSFIIL